MLTGDPRVNLSLLEALQRADPARLERIVAESLAQAAATSDRAPLGTRQLTWFRHPADKDGERGWSLPAIARQGTPDTVDVTAHDASGHQTVGASVRLIMDVGNWDASVAVNTPGQSGDPSSEHYADLTALWAAGKYFPLLYHADAVAAATASIVRLIDAGIPEPKEGY